MTRESVTNIFIANLSFGDILVIGFALPFRVSNFYSRGSREGLVLPPRILDLPLILIYSLISFDLTVLSYGNNGLKEKVLHISYEWGKYVVKTPLPTSVKKYHK